MLNILVTGASGIIGYGIIRSLKMSNEKYNIIGSSIYEDSPANAFSDIFELAVNTNKPEYLNWIKETVNKHSVDLIIPGIEDDVYKLINLREDLDTKVVLNNAALIELCKNKWNFFNILNEAMPNICIPTSIRNDFAFYESEYKLPFLMKPITGHGSKGILRINSFSEFNAHAEKIGNFLMVQPIVGSDSEEFTVSAFCDGNGSYSAIIIMKRSLSKDGFTEKAEIVNNDIIGLEVDKLCKIFKPIGPTNFQFRKQDDHYKLLEINPRISSSTSIRSKFGYNESEMSVLYFVNNVIPKQPQIKHGKAIRYIEDYIVYE